MHNKKHISYNIYFISCHIFFRAMTLFGERGKASVPYYLNDPLTRKFKLMSTKLTIIFAKLNSFSFSNF